MTSPNGFQNVVNADPAPAVEGDFASNNPRSTVLAGPLGLVAGLLGVLIGRFAWVTPDSGIVQIFGTKTAQPDGFVHRNQQGLVTTYLSESSLLIPQGFPVTLHNRGDFWAKLTGSTPATVGAVLNVDYSTGEISCGSLPVGASVTGSVGATFTASADTDTTRLVVTSLTGLISIGDTIAGVGITAGTKVIGQISGTTGLAGTYQLDQVNSASAATVTAFGTVLKVTAVGSGVLEVGDPLSGVVPAGAVLAAQISGTTGGIGLYTLSIPATAYGASGTVTAAGGVALTNWKAQSVAAVGELVKISTW